MPYDITIQNYVADDIMNQSRIACVTIINDTVTI